MDIRIEIRVFIMKIKKCLALLTAATLIFVSPMNSRIAFADEIEVAEDEEVSEEIPDTRVIPNGISIEGNDVSGMTVDEANEVVEQYLSDYYSAEFTLTGNDKSVVATGEELCLRAGNEDVTSKAAEYGNTGNFVERFKASSDLKAGRKKNFNITVSADIEGVKAYLEVASKKIDDAASDNTVKRENGEFVYYTGQSGMVVQIEDSAKKIVDFITNDWDGSSDATLELTVDMSEPRGDEQELSSIKDCLGSFQTSYSTSSAARKNNVANGVGFINGTVLYPGDEFSVLTTIQPFTEANGYKLAGSYANGQVVESFGGGICQVSTTLYGAVRAAELEIVTRSCHSMIIDYVPPSQDAAIAESGGKDFQIKNNKETPVYIEGYCDGSNVYFNIYGKEDRDSNRKVSYETEVLTVTPQETTWIADPTLPAGVMSVSTSGHTGYTGRLWKIVEVDGVEVSRDVYNNSKYNTQNRVVVIGVLSDNPNVTTTLVNAISTQNTETIAAAMASLGIANSVSFVITPKYQVTNPPDAEADPNAVGTEAPAVEEAPGI